MNRLPLLSFDRDIFQIQRHGGIRLYFTELNRALLVGFSSRVKLISPSFPSKVFPLVAELQDNAVFNGLVLCSLLTSFVVSMLPALLCRYPKIYHATYYRNPFLRWSLNPVVVTVHDMIHECFPQYFDTAYQASIQTYVKAKRRCIFAADAIIAVSHATKEDILRVYPDIDSSRIHVIYHGADHIPNIADEGRCQPPLVGVPFRRFLLYVGSREHYKGFNDLLCAFASFSNLYDDCGLVCVGKPFTDAEAAELSSLALTELVISVPANESELIALYRHALAFVYPSWREGFGLPILEAMRARCPVVCSDIPSSREIAGRHAFFFNPADPGDLLSTLSEILILSPIDLKMRLNASFDLASCFTWENTAALTCDLYLSLLR